VTFLVFLFKSLFESFGVSLKSLIEVTSFTLSLFKSSEATVKSLVEFSSL